MSEVGDLCLILSCQVCYSHFLPVALLHMGVNGPLPVVHDLFEAVGLAFKGLREVFHLLVL